MNNNTRTFTKIYNDYFDYDFSLEEIITISVVNSYTENAKPCYLTDEQLANYTKQSTRSVQRTLAKLEKLNVITRNTQLKKDNGQASRIRTLAVNDSSKWQKGIDKMTIPYTEGIDKNDTKVSPKTTKGIDTSGDILNNKLNNKQYYCANAQADAKDASSAQAQNEKAINALQQWMGADFTTATKYHGKIHEELTNNDIFRFLANTNKTAKDYQAQRKFGIDDFAVWFCEQAYKQAGLPG